MLFGFIGEHGEHGCGSYGVKCSVRVNRLKIIVSKLLNENCYAFIILLYTEICIYV